jgi:two-component system NtrC family sensor kinase
MAVEKHYGELPRISCRPADLTQVFLTLLRQAVSALDNQGAIGVTTRQVDDHLLVELAHDGKTQPVSLER